MPTGSTGLGLGPAHCPSFKVTSGSSCHSWATARLWASPPAALQGTPGHQGQPAACCCHEDEGWSSQQADTLSQVFLHVLAAAVS